MFFSFMTKVLFGLILIALGLPLLVFCGYLMTFLSIVSIPVWVSFMFMNSMRSTHVVYSFSWKPRKWFEVKDTNLIFDELLEQTSIDEEPNLLVS